MLASGRASDHKNSAKTQMITDQNQASENARAYPVSDTQRLPLVFATNVQGLLSNGRAWLKKLVHLRVRSLNIGSMNGKGREVADLLVRRKKGVLCLQKGVLCLQETRWKGNNARALGEGCKLIYSGANRDSRNGVGILLSEDLKDSLVGVSRRNDRIMSIKLGFEKSVNVVCAYAPQVGCREEEKDEFWEQLEQELSLIPNRERVILGGDLNGQVGRRRDRIERMHGGWGIGERNAEG